MVNSSHLLWCGAYIYRAWCNGRRHWKGEVCVPFLASSSISLEFTETSLCPSGPLLITQIGRELLLSLVHHFQPFQSHVSVPLPLPRHNGTLNNSKVNSFCDLVTFQVLARHRSVYSLISQGYVVIPKWFFLENQLLRRGEAHQSFPRYPQVGALLLSPKHSPSLPASRWFPLWRGRSFTLIYRISFLALSSWNLDIYLGMLSCPAVMMACCLADHKKIKEQTMQRKKWALRWTSVNI